MKKFKSFMEFTTAFSDQEKCLDYLCQVKWQNGFQCRRCGHNICIKGRAWYYRRCQKCRYDESCTSNTLFHKLKFSVVSAFWICYQLSNHKKGISTMEIARQYGIHQETAWFFKRKVQQAMSSSLVGDDSLEIRMFLPDKMDGKKGINCSDLGDRKNHIMATKKAAAIGNSSIHPRIIKIDHNAKEVYSAKRRVGREVKLEFCNPANGADNELYWYLYNMKNWLVGIHHQVSVFHSCRYFDEFCYRFIHRHRLNRQHLSLIDSMVYHRAQSYDSIKAK